MNAKIKAKWLVALRSGKYKQTKKMLRSKRGSYCCLGVVADIVRPKAWELDLFGHWCNGDSSTDLDIKLRQKTGLASGDMGVLMDLNDSGKRFTTIAKWIEKNL